MVSRTVVLEDLKERSLEDVLREVVRRQEVLTVRLPEGETVAIRPSGQQKSLGFVYPTRLVPADKLDALTGLVEIGGDALVDSEALYDPDWN